MTQHNWFTTNIQGRTLNNILNLQIYVNFREKINNKTFEENSNLTAKNIYDTYDNLYYSCSGGLDSEYILRTFKNNGLKLTPVMIRSIFNQEESEISIKLCKELGFDLEIIDLAPDIFVYELYELTCKRGFYSLIGGIPLLIEKYTNGKILTGCGDIINSNKVDIKVSTHISTELEFPEYDFYLSDDHPSAFFMYNPSLICSYIRELDFNKNYEVSKCELYRIKYRNKIFWKPELYQIAHSLNVCHANPYFLINKNIFMGLFNETNT